MFTGIREKYLREIFVTGLILKGINALLEIVGGILFYFTGTLTSIIIFLTRKELIEDPTDFIANQTRKIILPYLSNHSPIFGTIYLLSHGLIKIILIIALLKNKLWAYPATIVVFSIFIIYQLYRFTFTHSWFLIALSVFDALLVALTWHEYNFFKRRSSGIKN